MEDVVTRQIMETLRIQQDAARRMMQALMPDLAAAEQDGAPASAPPPQAAEQPTVAQPVAGPHAHDIGAAARTMMDFWFQRPDVAVENITRFWAEQVRVLTGTSSLEPARDDHRFDDPQWKENPIYHQGMQTYLLVRDGLQQWADTLPVEHKESERIKFLMSLVTEALAPSNWPTSPAALKRYVETGGASALRGLKNIVDDLVHNQGMPSTVKRGVLEVGKDLATTPGKVIHRTDVFELIQYAPVTPNVYERPYLMVPPQINKFYFYDLSPKKSLVHHALESGLQVFTISWRNPTQEHRHWNFDTYIAAIEEAIDVVRDVTGSPDVNIEGGCVGGMTVVALLAHLAARGERKVKSATLMVTLLDTSFETQLSNLATPEAIEMARMGTSARGVLDGSEMGRVFAFLRPNDLVWNYWVNNYLLGNDPPTFDVLAWNADTSRMAADFHLELLEFVQHNRLARGEFKVMGEPVALDKIDCDQYWMAGQTDHITPWRGCYKSSQLLGGQRTFIVSDGGHIQAMIASPSNPKARFVVGNELPPEPDDWLAKAEEHHASWWQHWRDWITQRSGSERKARKTLGNARHKPLADAPGTYVFE
jgi:polyhydroxyalkanoate synthase subunit PhaC